MATRRTYDPKLATTQQTTVQPVAPVGTAAAQPRSTAGSGVEYPTQDGFIDYGNQPGVPPGGVPPIPPPATTQTYALEGFDPAKLASDHNSPKYQIGRTIQQFDPSAGITPELLAALNALGIGDFTQLSGDKLSVGGNVDPRFEGYTTIDLIRNFTGEGDKAWQYGAENPNAPQQQSAYSSLPQTSVMSQIQNLMSGGLGQPQSQGLSQPAAQGGAPTGGQPPSPGWVQTATGAWVPPDHPLAQGPLAQPGNPAQGQGGSSSSTQPFMGDEIKAKIMELLNTGGAFNQQLMDSRSESLREGLERQRGVETQSLDALLAERGLTGGGGDIAARSNMGERLGTQHATALRDLVGNESQRADSRMMQALQTGAGMSISEAQQAIDWFNAQTGRTGTEGNLANQASEIELRRLLGLGELGLGQAGLEANFLLGQGRLGLDRDLGMLGQQNTTIDQILRALGLQGGVLPQQ
jgi:hypothetical protein